MGTDALALQPTLQVRKALAGVTLVVRLDSFDGVDWIEPGAFALQECRQIGTAISAVHTAALGRTPVAAAGLDGRVRCTYAVRAHPVGGVAWGTKDQTPVIAQPRVERIGRQAHGAIGRHQKNRTGQQYQEARRE